MIGPPSPADSRRWPNFFVAGVPKAGSTALYHQLRQHPQIYMSPVKEPRFFCADDLLTEPIRGYILRELSRRPTGIEALLGKPSSLMEAWRVVAEESEYVRLFDNVRDEIAIGEASVTYFWLQSAARAIAARLPRARLIFILRDPAERAFSQYLASIPNERPVPFRERFRRAIEERESHGWWLESGRYATHLSRFFACFPREQIRVYLYHEYRDDAAGTLRDMFTFLGVDPGFQVDVSRRYNEPSVPRWPWLHAWRRRLFGRVRLTRRFPKAVRPLIRAVYHRRRRDLQMDPADRPVVIDYYRDEILRTAELIGRDLSSWLR